MSREDKKRWNEKYAARRAMAPVVAMPDEWLMRHVQDKAPGRALDLACGLGHNAVWLAGRGWKVDAIDISSVGLQLAAELAQQHGAVVNWIEADLEALDALPGVYDLIIVFRFLDRARLPQLITRALRPGAYLVYESFTSREAERPGSHLRNPDYLLDAAELPRLFSPLVTLAYQESDLPDRSIARLLARKPHTGDPPRPGRGPGNHE
jgi:SAM-dependent methyltransferase